jgi:hypothetical protein
MIKYPENDERSRMSFRMRMLSATVLAGLTVPVFAAGPKKISRVQGSTRSHVPSEPHRKYSLSGNW